MEKEKNDIKDQVTRDKKASKSKITKEKKKIKDQKEDIPKPNRKPRREKSTLRKSSPKINSNTPESQEPQQARQPATRKPVRKSSRVVRYYNDDGYGEPTYYNRRYNYDYDDDNNPKVDVISDEEPFKPVLPPWMRSNRADYCEMGNIFGPQETVFNRGPVPRWNSNFNPYGGGMGRPQNPFCDIWNDIAKRMNM